MGVNHPFARLVCYIFHHPFCSTLDSTANHEWNEKRDEGYEKDNHDARIQVADLI